MKRTAVSLIHLGMSLTTALLAGCAAPPAPNSVGLTAIGSATAHATPATAVRLGAGDALGTIMFAGGDDAPRFDEGSRYTTVNED